MFNFRSQRMKLLSGFAFTGFALLLAFQNCGEGFKALDELESVGALQQSPPPQSVSCSFNSQELADGASTFGYTSATVAFGVSCDTVRTEVSCANGVLSQPNAFGSCAVTPAATCNFNGQTVAHGASIRAYQAGMVPFGQTCAQEMRVCTNGVLNGTFTFGNCNVGAPASCTFNGQTLASGASANGFTAATVPFGQTCATVATRVSCTNGLISPNPSFPTCSVLPGAACSFNGQTLATGASVVAYQTATVPFGQTCAQESRMCVNGLLGGSFAFTSCAVTAPVTDLSVSATRVNSGENFVLSWVVPTGTSRIVLSDGTSSTDLTGRTSAVVNRVVAAPTTLTYTLTATTSAGPVADTATVAINTALPTFKQVATGRSHTCALSNLNEVWCWGGNETAESGLPSVVRHTAPSKVAGLVNIKQISTGGPFNCAITAQDTVKCWGFAGGFGFPQPAPYDVPGLTGVKQVVVGDFRTCAITAQDTVACWAFFEGNTARTQPQAVPALTGVRSLSIGTSHACALTALGTVKCWGENGTAELGNSSTVDSLTPVDVIGLTGATQVLAGSGYSCALTASGPIKCWGRGYAVGQSGGTSIASPTDVPGISGAKQLVGSSALCAITSDDQVKCWGDNSSGLHGVPPHFNYGITAVRVPGLSGIKQIALTSLHACAVTAQDTVKCWGSNSSGELGDNLSGVVHTPKPVHNLTGIKQVSEGANYTCAITAQDTVQCWGANRYGQLGNNSPLGVDSATPVAVGNLTGVTAIATSREMACALTSSQSVWCWGAGWNNQTYVIVRAPVEIISLRGAKHITGAGSGRTICAHTAQDTARCFEFPTQVPTDSPGAENIRQLSNGGYHQCFITTGGVAKCWGNNNSRELGDGTQTNRQTPVDVINLNNPKMIVAGASLTCAITAQDTVRCWGYDYDGQTRVGDLTAVRSISVSYRHACAIKTNNTVKCWGRSSTFGSLGLTASGLPLLDAGSPSVSNVATLHTGALSTYVTQTDGRLLATGYLSVVAHIPVDVSLPRP